MADSVFSVDGMLCLVQKLRQEKAECEETISHTRHKAWILERRVEEMARQVGAASAVKEEKGAMLVDVKGRVEARQKMFNQMKKGMDLPRPMSRSAWRG